MQLSQYPWIKSQAVRRRTFASPTSASAPALSASAPQGIDGHRSSLTKFAELLLLHGAINTQQLAIALELVDLVFDQGGAQPTTLLLPLH